MTARLGLIGGGVIGRHHIAVARRVPEARIVALADPTAAGAALAAEAGIPAFADAAAMLAAGGLDGVIVATPNATHVPLAIAALEAGVPVLVEKPVAESVAAAMQLVEAGRRTGVPVLVGHHRRHNPRLRAARDLIASGALGRIVSVTALCLFRKPDAYFTVDWRTKPGGGPVIINAIHDIDCLRFLIGEVEAVTALTACAARGHAVEDTASALLTFAGGAIGTLTVSDAVVAPWTWDLTTGENPGFPVEEAEAFLIGGTEGSLAVPSLTVWRHTGAGAWQDPMTRTRLKVAGADPFERQLAHFAAVIAGREQPVVSAEDGARTLAATLAILDSARRGQPVAPALPEPALG